MFMKNPRTLAQQQQRLKMTSLVRLSKAWLVATLKGFPGSNIVEAQNRFVQCNMPAVTVDEELAVTYDFGEFKCSRGPIVVPEISAALSSGSITFQIKEQILIPKYCEGTDMLHAVVYEGALSALELVEVGMRNSGGGTQFSLPEGWSEENVTVLAFALDQRGKRASDTVKVALTTA